MSEVALTVVLLIGAGLALRSVYHLIHAGLDVDPAKVLVLEVTLPDARYPAESPQRVDFFTQLLTRLQALPNVEAAGLASFTPYLNRARIPVITENSSDEANELGRWTDQTSVSPDYFKAVGLRLVRGRGFTPEDRKGAPEVAVINETMARRYWPGADPIGKRVAPGRGANRGPWITVVGVVRDLRAGGIETSRNPEMYSCSHQSPWFRTVVVRVAANPRGLVPQIRSSVRDLDKSLPWNGVQTLDGVLNGAAADTRALGRLLVFFALLALALAVVGIYGVLAYSVAQRTHEFGVRVAFGAQKTDLAILVLKWGGRLALIGSAFGLLLALWLTRFLAHLLQGVSPIDPVTFAAVALMLPVVALLACYLPARRATQADPMVALRCE